MKPTSIDHSQFESLYATQQRFFKYIIARYFEGPQQQDVLQDFAIHLFVLLHRKKDADVHLFESKAWLRKVLVHFCISQLRREKAQKNNVWTKTITQHIIVADEMILGKEQALKELYQEALGCVSKKEALVLKMKYEYKCSAKEIERRLGLPHVDVLLGRIKAKIKNKMGRIELEWW
jgi:RNA polymerase sigma factor (sigma-70 family)